LGFGAVTAKSITIQPRPGHPQPNLVRTSTDAGPGLVNCNGFQNPGLERFRASLAPLAHRVPLIVSVAGETIADYVKLVQELGPLGELVEFNISSPNTRLVYEWSRKPGELATLLREVRRATEKPPIVKLSPISPRRRAGDHSGGAERGADRLPRQHKVVTTGSRGTGGPGPLPGDPENSANAPRLRQGLRHRRDGRRRFMDKGAAARRRRDGSRLFHRIRHARADSGAADPRATRREPLSTAPAALKMLTAYPLVHHYPQTTKSHGLTRAHERTAGI
jgi:hypothetical protein